MDEMNKIPDEQNNEELKEKETTMPEPSEINETAVETPTPKAPMSKLPLIIGGVVAGIAAIAVSVVIAIVFMFASYNEPACKHDDPTKIVACEAKTPTCQETGLTEGMKCTLCDTMVVAQMVIPKKDCIEGNWIVDKEATKTEDGKKHTECTMCHRKMKDVIIPAGSQGLRYTLNDDGESYSVAGMGSCTDADIVIPITYNGKPVTTIGSEFKNCTSLTSVVIPDSVTTIGHHAFYNCYRLTSVVIGDSVTTIDDWAFSSCSKLKFNEYENGKYLGNEDNPYFALVELTSKNLSSCTIHEDTKIIAGSVFSGCERLTSITIPDSVVTIGSSAFYRCESLTSAVIPNSVTTIGDYAFVDCTSLTSVVIPDSVTSIGRCAFHSCTSLASVVIPNSVTTIGASAFYNCSKLKFNEYENGKYLGNEDNPYYALVQLTSMNLSSYTIHEDTKIIAGRVFENYERLTSITIPNSVTTIGEYVFCSCTSLKTIDYKGTKAEWKNITKGQSWKTNTGNYKVVCSDGEITKGDS